MSSHSRRRQGRRLPRFVVPLGFYLAVTLVAPALNGATRRAGFWEHAAITLVVSGAIAAVAVAGEGRNPTRFRKTLADSSGHKWKPMARSGHRGDCCPASREQRSR